MLDHEVYDLQSTEKREAREESHCAANGPKLVGKSNTHVLDDLVVSNRVKVDLDNVEGLVRFGYNLECIPVTDNFKVLYLRSLEFFIVDHQ